MIHAFTWHFDIEIYRCVTVFHSLKPLGWLAFSWCFAHLDTFGMIVFLDFFIFVLRLQWAKKLGWLFLAVGGRSSMENDCWLQRWVALTLGISYGSHPLTSYIFLYLPTCFFVSTGAMLNVLWLVSLSGSLVHPRSGEPRLIGTGDSGRCTEIGKKGRIARIASDIGNEHWRYMNIHEYTYILRTVHESWIWNDFKNPEDIWEVSVWCCLPVFIFCITWQGGWLLDSHLMCDMGLMASRWAELSQSSKRSGVANGTWTYYMWSLILVFTHIYSHIIIIMIITISVVATIISTYM